MDNLKIITDKTHPIEKKWIIIAAVSWSPFLGLFFAAFLWLIISAIVFFLGIRFTGFLVSYIYIIGVIIGFVAIVLSCKNIHYEFKEQFIIYKHGIIAKSERHIPYGRIQHILFSQGLIDRLLDFASIRIGTAAEGGGESKEIEIPGLLYENVVDLKNTLIKLIKINPINDKKSGL